MISTFTISLAAVFAILGAILASFTGVIAERIHTGQSWWSGRSRCNSCRRTLDVLDLMPVVSWLMHRGRCRTCKSKIPGAYIAFEVALGSVFALSYLHLGLTPVLPIFLAFLVVLDFVVMYDLRHTIVPMLSAGILIVLGVVLAYLQAGSLPAVVPTLIAAVIIAGGFLLVHVCSRGRAMGLGDTPISFALSLAIGYPASVAGVVFSFWIGAVIGICLLLVQRGRTTMKSEIPFVPFLALGYLLAFFSGWNPFFLI